MSGGNEEDICEGRSCYLQMCVFKKVNCGRINFTLQVEGNILWNIVRRCMDVSLKDIEKKLL